METSVYPVGVAREDGIKSKATVSLLVGGNINKNELDVIVNVLFLM